MQEKNSQLKIENVRSYTLKITNRKPEIKYNNELRKITSS